MRLGFQLGLYLWAAVVANLAIAHYGPSATVVVAFFAIGFSMTVRDAIHDQLQGWDLTVVMLLLILMGALLSYIFNPDAGRIGFASGLAFLLSESTDALIYHRLRRRKWIIRSNTSNIGAAIVDSLVFPTIAFGVLLPHVVLGQFLAKVLGGFWWSFLINQRR